MLLLSAVLLCPLAADSAAVTTGGCDGINCWATPTTGSTRFSAEQLAAAVPIQPVIVESTQSRSTAPTAAAGGCTPPVRLNASACRSSGLPCGSMGKLFMKVGGQMSSCSASFIATKYVLTAGHCCMDRGPGVWSTDMEFYLDWESGAPSPGFLDPFVPINMLVPQQWRTRA